MARGTNAFSHAYWIEPSSIKPAGILHYPTPSTGRVCSGGNQTLRRLGGRHPLCGIGVTSLIAEISNPAACSARMADSRPAPGPFTQTSTRFNPNSIASLAAASAASCAAKGVLFRDPLNAPPLPPLDQLSEWPCVSDIVMIVLLNVA
jgi:hypothetical protein